MVQTTNSSYITLSDDEDDMPLMPKTETEQDIPSSNMYLHQIGENVASSSGTNPRSSFIGMGFSPILIEKVIKEKGEDDFDLLLETLIELSAYQQSNSESPGSLNATVNGRKSSRELLGGSSMSNSAKALNISTSTSSDSLDSIFDDEKGEETQQAVESAPPTEEPIFLDEIDNGIRASLLGMNFSLKEVEFAIDKLGKEAPIDELIDFITATQVAESEDNDYKENNEDNNPETLYGTMDRTLRLLEMGFSEQDVSSAIESFEEEAPLTELADWICAGRPARPSVKLEEMSDLYPMIKTEDGCLYTGHQTGGMTLDPLYGVTVPKEEYDESGSSMRGFDLDNIKGKRVKEEYEDSVSAALSGYPSKKPKMGNPNLFISPPAFSTEESNTLFRKPTMPSLNPNRILDKMVAPPPFFLYGNVVNLSNDSWNKMSQFLYALQPEFANSQFFSAMSRKEGYLHNLPTDERFLVEPSPATIEEAMPHTKKWWPSWDTRKQLSCISTETTGVTQICDNLRKMLVDSKGLLSPEQQTKVLYHCRTLNLVWVGKYKLAPIEPEYLERILGYPVNHTKSPEIRLAEQLELLRNCFQTDTLAYHLSPLKNFYPEGVTVLSIYGGVGGAEVALHRLGIRLRGVVSVETSETKRKILKKWWESSRQTGELVQVEDAQKLSTNKLEYFLKKFGGFDLVVGQNPCTYTARTSKVMGKTAEVVGLDFTLYFEFIRVLQHVRSMMQRS